MHTENSIQRFQSKVTSRSDPLAKRGSSFIFLNVADFKRIHALLHFGEGQVAESPRAYHIFQAFQAVTYSADFSPTRGSTRIRVSTQVFWDPCFASSRCRRVERGPAAHIVQAPVSGRSEPSISAWPSGSITRQTRIQASGRPMEDT